MATLNTLRTKGGIIVTIVIGIALLAFLLGDLTGNGSVFSSKVKVGKINGKDISYMELYDEIEYLTNIQKIISGSENSQQQEMIRDISWEEIKRSHIIYPGLEELGITVSEDEMFDMVYGNNISPVLTSFGFFNNQQTGMFDKSLLKNFVSNLGMDNTGQMRTIWEYMQGEIRKDAVLSKYMVLVKNMAYVTEIEANFNQNLTNNNYDAKYVSINYETVADSLATVSNSEVKKYYDENIRKYRQTASRDIEYVIFDVKPSLSDYEEAKEYFYTLYDEFVATDNVRQFVTLNSQSSFDEGYYSEAQFPVEISEFVFSDNNKGVYGPELIDDVYRMLRVSELKNIPDSLGIRQIVISPFDTALADSLETALNGGADFNVAAFQHSLNQGSADMGTIPTIFIPSQILDPILETPEGKITRVDTPNGIMLLDVYKRGRNELRAQVGTVTMEVVPSSATQQDVYSKASTFYTKVGGSPEKFNTAVDEENLNKRVVRISKDDSNINGLTDSKEIVRWAFNAKVKDVSGIMESNGDYVIAVLKEAREKGYAPVEQVRGEIATELRKQKKADIISSKLAGSSLEKAAADHKTSVEEIVGLNFNTYYVPGIGMDMKLIGTVAVGLELNKVSKPVQGVQAVYLVEVVSEETSSETISVVSDKARIEASKVNDVENRLTDALYELADIEDYRVKYF
ncbi:MAG: SurA N-terminal domain-containing protein [Rikenellaceae bacterium]|nr:SurA N-terminal domain-containing protein [Rikenellaceae bacterium]